MEENNCMWCGTKLPIGQPCCINEPEKLINSNTMSPSLCFKDYLTMMKIETTLSPDSEGLRDFKVNGAEYVLWYKSLTA